MGSGFVKYLAVACISAIVAITPATANGDTLRVATGGPTGSYFVVGNAICLMMQSARRSLFLTEGGTASQGETPPCSVLTTGGSVDNVRMLAGRTAEIAIVQADVQRAAVEGEGAFRGQRISGLRSLFSVYVEPFHLVASLGSNIQNWDDLRGKRVNVGNRGSGQRATFEALLASSGRSLRDFSPASELSSTQQSSALCEDRIDAYGFTVGAPNEAVQRVLSDCGARLISLGDRVVDQLLRERRDFTRTRIARGTYEGQDANIDTMGVVATVIAGADVSDARAYEIVKSVFSDLGFFRKLHPALNNVTQSQMLPDGKFMEVHPGARRFFREKGLL